MDDAQRELLKDADAAARSLHRAARTVEYVALLALVLLVLFLLTDAYGWQAFTGLTVTVLISVLLAGRMARARAVALRVAAQQLEVTIATRDGARAGRQ